MYVHVCRHSAVERKVNSIFMYPKPSTPWNFEKLCSSLHMYPTLSDETPWTTWFQQWLDSTNTKAILLTTVFSTALFWLNTNQESTCTLLCLLSCALETEVHVLNLLCTWGQRVYDTYKNRLKVSMVYVSHLWRQISRVEVPLARIYAAAHIFPSLDAVNTSTHAILTIDLSHVKDLCINTVSHSRQPRRFEAVLGGVLHYCMGVSIKILGTFPRLCMHYISYQQLNNCLCNSDSGCISCVFDCTFK